MWVWARHGNTFGPNDAVVYAGKSNDLPLVAHGIEQAHRLADAWLAFGVRPMAIYCGSLVRLRQTAEIVCRRLGWPVQQVKVDVRLDELDYGAWTGQTRQQVVAQFGEKSVLAWEQHSIWPSEAGWTSSAAVVQQEISEWMKQTRQTHLGSGPILAISSNGRLRYALTQVAGAFEQRVATQRIKVKTGHVGALWQAEGDAQLICWNEPPAAALGRIAQHNSDALDQARKSTHTAPCSL